MKKKNKIIILGAGPAGLISGWFLTKKNKRVKVLDAKISITDNNLKPGEVTGGLIVGCKNNAIEILSVQPEGKKIMDIEDYLRGNPISVGEILE